MQTCLRRTAKPRSLNIVLPLIWLAKWHNLSNKFWTICSNKIVSEFSIQTEKLLFFNLLLGWVLYQRFLSQKNYHWTKGSVQHSQVFSFEKLSLTKSRIYMVVCRVVIRICTKGKPHCFSEHFISSCSLGT